MGSTVGSQLEGALVYFNTRDGGRTKRGGGHGAPNPPGGCCLGLPSAWGEATYSAVTCAIEYVDMEAEVGKNADLP